MPDFDERFDEVARLVQHAIDSGAKGVATKPDATGVSLTATGITFDILNTLNLIGNGNS